MTRLDISSIKDATLRNAAEAADINDNTANRGKLDQRELSVFIKEAVNSNCDKAAIAKLCNQVGVEHASDEVKASMEKLNQLQKLEKMLKEQMNILKKKHNERYELQEKNEDIKSCNILKSTVTYGAYFGAGALAGAKVGAIFGVTGVVIGAILGGGIGLCVAPQADLAFNPKRNYTGKIIEKDKQIEQVHNKVHELESKIEEVQKSL